MEIVIQILAVIGLIAVIAVAVMLWALFIGDEYPNGVVSVKPGNNELHKPHKFGE